MQATILQHGRPTKSKLIEHTFWVSQIDNLKKEVDKFSLNIPMVEQNVEVSRKTQIMQEQAQ